VACYTKAPRLLDLPVVADHAENLGLPLLLTEGDGALRETEYGRRFYDLIQSGRDCEAFQLWGNDGMAATAVRSRIRATCWSGALAGVEWADSSCLGRVFEVDIAPGG
jgi:hypothetical protein